MTPNAPTEKSQSPLDRFRSRLIGPTLDSAREIPFYSRYWEGRPLELDQLPTVTKGQLLQDLPSTLRPGGVPVNVGHSTGTTGQPFFRVRGQAEIDAYSEYLRSVRKATVARTGPGAVGACQPMAGWPAGRWSAASTGEVTPP